MTKLLVAVLGTAFLSFPGLAFAGPLFDEVAGGPFASVGELTERPTQGSGWWFELGGGRRFGFESPQFDER